MTPRTREMRRTTDTDFWARTHETLERFHLLITVVGFLGAIVGFTVITPAQAARQTREELHAEIVGVRARQDTLQATVNVRITPLESDIRTNTENLAIMLRYLCAVGPGSVQVKRASGLTPAKCGQE